MEHCNLADKSCTPCKGEQQPFSLTEATEHLATLSENWGLNAEGTRLTRYFKFKNFARALSFTNALGKLAEEEGHHPDFELGWGYVVVHIQTHSINGLSENDFILAAKTDAAFNSWKADNA